MQFIHMKWQLKPATSVSQRNMVVRYRLTWTSAMNGLQSRDETARVATYLGDCDGVEGQEGMRVGVGSVEVIAAVGGHGTALVDVAETPLVRLYGAIILHVESG